MKKIRAQNSIFTLSVMAGLLPLGNFGCVAPTGVQAGNSYVLVTPTQTASVSVKHDDEPSKQVCDPFGTGGVSSADHGIYGKLTYLQDGAPRASQLSDFQKYGTPVDVNLFFNQLNIPTRKFDQGFQTQNGNLLKTQDGNTLYEWFSLHFETKIKLSFMDSPGKYQFAVLSDDGSVVQIGEPSNGNANGNESGDHQSGDDQQNSDHQSGDNSSNDSEGDHSSADRSQSRFDQVSGIQFNTLIDNDGVTASRLRCAGRTVTMDATTSLPMKVDYFQGPRYHIALVLLWRRIPDTGCYGDDSNSLADPMCDQSGNGVYFDSTQSPSAPTDNWIGLLDRGWNVVSPENYYLPDAIQSNPCVGHPSPTPAPSASPTPAPSASPTPAPSASPTPAPSASPTPAPSASPTPAPSASPTPAPSASPTPAPSASPTPAPSASPSPGCVGPFCGGAVGV